MEFKTALFCEIDEYAAKSYCAIHGVPPELNVGSITDVDEKEVPNFNTMFGGSPCQDFSIAGRNKGAVWTCVDCGAEYNPLTVHYSARGYCPNCGSVHIEKTRSSLLVEWLRFLREKRPRFAIYENVKNIVSKRFGTTFDLFIQELSEYGYNVYWKVLNAKDYGVPQNRERVYCVIIRKDLDRGYSFPEATPLRRFLPDLMEEDVDERYYMDDGKLPDIIAGATVPIRVRKLTPLECWRIMGFDDVDFCAAKDVPGATETKLIKQAGNSIVVDVLEAIMRELRSTMPYLFSNMVVGSFFSGIGAFEKALSRVGADLAPAADGRQADLLKGNLHQIGYINNYNGDANRVYDGTCIARTLKAEAGGGGAKTGWYTETVKIKQATRSGEISCAVGGVANLAYPNSETRRGRVQGGGMICPTITASSLGVYRIEKKGPYISNV